MLRQVTHSESELCTLKHQIGVATEPPPPTLHSTSATASPARRALLSLDGGTLRAPSAPLARTDIRAGPEVAGTRGDAAHGGGGVRASYPPHAVLTRGAGARA
eukprot:1193248-Prorocentrum_minimum.AAC.4